MECFEALLSAPLVTTSAITGSLTATIVSQGMIASNKGMVETKGGQFPSFCSRNSGVESGSVVTAES